MEYVLSIFIFIFGLAIGSFINALEYRIDKKMSIQGRSLCPKCKHTLSWYDLVPIVSYVVLAGKCRYCKKKISWQYPLVELLSGAVLTVVVATSGYLHLFTGAIEGVLTQRELVSLIVGTLSLLIITFVVVLVGLHDYKTGYILSHYVYLGIFAAVAYNLARYEGAYTTMALGEYVIPFLLAAIVPAALFFGLYYLSKGRWMGSGDYELALLIGLFLGFPLAVPAYYFAFIVGSVVGLVLVYVQKSKKMNSAIPFGPFLMAGLVFSYTIGQYCIDIYGRIFLGL